MHKRYSATVPVVIALFFAGGCQCGERGAADRPQRPAPISHIVFAELVSPDDAGALIRDCDENLASIDAIRTYSCGRHFDIGRASTLNDYDVCLVLGFETEADLRAYIASPQHVELVNRWKSRTRRLRVHDFLDPTP
jgi:hypothetical protein